jgi:hypothetical protein
MPVAWEHAEHTESIQASFEIPKDFPPFSSVQSFTAEINDDALSPTDTHFDKHSSDESNIIHFVIPGSELVHLKNTSDIEKNSSVEISIGPEIPTSIVTKEIQFDNGYGGVFSHDSRYGQNKEVLFTIEFFDASGNRASDIRYAYSIKDTFGKESVNTGGNSQILGIMLENGVDSRAASAPHEGKYTIQFVLIGKGQNDFERFSYKSLDFEMKATESKGISPSPAVQSRVPEWVKNNAKWWADGSIDDNSFVQGIQFLIKEKILNVKTAGSSGVGSQDIPAWIKNNAKWWADGMIGEEDFLNGIEHLVNAGILKAN